ncbi:MAG: c-type cytochrome [Bacillota bacterium]
MVAKIYFWVFIVSLTAMLAAFFTLVAGSLGAVGPVPEEVVAGKRVWQEKGCVECHTILGNGGYSAGDVTKVISLRGQNRLEMFFQNPPVMHPSKTRKHMGLDRQQAREMIAYLRFLSRIPTEGWPPQPVKPIPSIK